MLKRGCNKLSIFCVFLLVYFFVIPKLDCEEVSNTNSFFLDISSMRSKILRISLETTESNTFEPLYIALPFIIDNEDDLIVDTNLFFSMRTTLNNVTFIFLVKPPRVNKIEFTVYNPKVLKRIEISRFSLVLDFRYPSTTNGLNWILQQNNTIAIFPEVEIKMPDNAIDISSNIKSKINNKGNQIYSISEEKRLEIYWSSKPTKSDYIFALIIRIFLSLLMVIPLCWLAWYVKNLWFLNFLFLLISILISVHYGIKYFGESEFPLNVYFEHFFTYIVLFIALFISTYIRMKYPRTN